MEDVIAYDFEKELLETLPALKNAATKYSSNYADSGDLLQSVVERALIHRDSFLPGTNMKAWLHMILRNHALSGFRKYKNREAEMAEGQAERIPIAASALHALELKEALKAITYISPTNRSAFELVVMQEMPYEEAALQMNVSLGTVKSRVSRARLELFAYFNMDTTGVTLVGKT